jgi:serine/threonine-protein kinase
MGEAEPLAGRVLAEKYLLVSRLGEGGFGSIWRAVHQVLKSEVAVKLIDLDMARKDGAVERFLREAQATAALRSPHVVQVLDYGVDGDQPFIVMELLEGENLADRIERVGALPPLEVLRIVTHVARAMGKAHELGIVHRDLKPENIFLVNNGDEEIAKVLDFGVAKFASVDLNQDTYTITGSLIGTPYYMSPEQAQGNKAVDHRSDLWALGVIAFEMITGRRPFDGEALGDLVLTICVRSIAIPSAVAAVPAGFDAWFAKAVERDPAARFQSAREMAIALLQIIEGDTDIRYTRTEELAIPTVGAEIPSRPNASAFAATVRDDVSLGSLSVVTASSPQASSPVNAVHAANATRYPVTTELVEEEQLTPWSLAGIATLALAAGAAAVYGLFFLFRAHEASNNDSSDPLAADARPSATLTAPPVGTRHHFDVAATHKPNGSGEPPPVRPARTAHDASASRAAVASAAPASPTSNAVPTAAVPAPLEPELQTPPLVPPPAATMPPMIAPAPPQNLTPESPPQSANPAPAFSAEPQPLSATTSASASNLSEASQPPQSPQLAHDAPSLGAVTPMLK